MKAIYEPRGPAREYAPLACNLFTGCTNGCRYCYVPGVLRTDRDAFHREVRPREDKNEGILEALVRDARRFQAAGDTRRVHLCFTCDPFPSGALVNLVTKPALRILRDAGRPVSVLTKNAHLAFGSLDLLADMDAVAMVSLVWANDVKRSFWEPETASVAARLHYIGAAAAMGIRTAASVEPVVELDEGLDAIDALMRVGCEDIRVGKLNHADTPHPVDWRAFAHEVSRRLRVWAAEKPGRVWMLKKGLVELVEG